MPTGDGVFIQATTVEESVVKQIAPRRHIVVFSTDGKVEVPVYKCSDGRYHAIWRDSKTGARLSKPKKKREDAIQLARDVCARLWEEQGFGTKEDCRVLVGEPRRSYERKNHVFGKPLPAACKTVRFKPEEFGWRHYFVELIYSSDLTSTGKVVLLYVWDRAYTTGEFFASKRKTEKDTHVSRRYLKDIFPALEQAGWLVAIGREDNDITRYGLLLPADVYAKLKAATEKRRHPGGGGTKFPPPPWELSSANLGTKFPHNEYQLLNENNKERVLATRLKNEKEILANIGEISPKEKEKNGGMWCNRIRLSPTHRLAVLYAVENWKCMSPDERAKIRNRGAWLTNGFYRALVEIDTRKKVIADKRPADAPAS